MCHRQLFKDAKTYANPEVFAPERFIGETKERDPREYLFGFGRRYVSLADESNCILLNATLLTITRHIPVFAIRACPGTYC
jgi:hypothetical protein